MAGIMQVNALVPESVPPASQIAAMRGPQLT
jgi:hypothetical protein